jgi:hypothetical protein
VTSKHRWAARTTVLALSATVLVGVSSGSASAGTGCVPPGPHRPSGPLTDLITPLFGEPGYPTTPLGDLPVSLTGALDTVICSLLPPV